MSARFFVSLSLLVLFAACPRPPPIVTEDDAGEPEQVVFDGPTANAGIPALSEEFALDASIPAIDSGVIVVDTRCCATNFSISDQEPAAGVTVGTLRIELNAFSSGVALTRAGGRWRGSACFPLNVAAPYHYEFAHDAGLVDAGEVALEDGGVVIAERLELRTTWRASDEEPGFDLADGQRTNFFRAVSSCDGLDGSVPP
ncbi:MAG: hypothetical protein GQE15_33490 [Archangiaceae bacterium]|nr:hypothetical protein [Archangiaceae bacterium]